VQKGSWRWLYYEGILVGTIVLHASVVFFGAYRLYSHSFSWPETLGLFFSASLVAIFGHNVSHEIEHRKAPFYRKILGFFYAYNFFRFKYHGHVELHHNPLFTATKADYFSFAAKNISYFTFLKQAQSNTFPKDDPLTYKKTFQESYRDRKSHNVFSFFILFIIFICFFYNIHLFQSLFFVLTQSTLGLFFSGICF